MKDEKYCSSCGEKINAKAFICPKCGVKQLQKPNGSKNKITAGLLGLFLGLLGIHHFYLGNSGRGVLYLLVGTFGWILVFPPLVLAVVVLIESIQLLTISDDEFDRKYNV